MDLEKTGRMVAIFPAVAGTTYVGTVVKIADGDTLTLLVDSKQHKIRLSDIDTPEGALNE